MLLTLQANFTDLGVLPPGLKSWRLSQLCGHYLSLAEFITVPPLFATLQLREAMQTAMANLAALGGADRQPASGQAGGYRVDTAESPGGHGAYRSGKLRHEGRRGCAPAQTQTVG